MLCGAWVAKLVEGPAFSPGHDLVICGLEPGVRLCADSSGPGACFRFCLSLSLSLSLKKKKKNNNNNKLKKIKKNFFN